MFGDERKHTTPWKAQMEKLAEKWHRGLRDFEEIQDDLSMYQQNNSKGLTNLKIGPPTWLDTISKSIWRHQMQLALHKCIECIELPAQKAKVKQIWCDLLHTLTFINSKTDLDRVGELISRGLKRGISNLYSKDIPSKNKKHSTRVPPPPPPTLLPPPPPPPPFLPPLPPPPPLPSSSLALEKPCSYYAPLTTPQGELSKVTSTTVDMSTSVQPGEPTRVGFPRGEEFTPLANDFAINQAVQPTRDMAKILAYGIFGTKKKAPFLYRSIYKHMLWYEREGEATFSPKCIETKEGSKVRVGTWREWKEVVRKMKGVLNNEQVELIASLYQIQVRFFIYGQGDKCTFVCRSQTRYLHHRVVNILQLEGGFRTILQGTTLPVLIFDRTVGKYDLDYYTVCYGLEKRERGLGVAAGTRGEGRVEGLNETAGGIGGGTKESEGKGVRIQQEDSSNNSNLAREPEGQWVERKYSDATSTDLLSMTSIERRVGRLSITGSSVFGGGEVVGRDIKTKTDLNTAGMRVEGREEGSDRTIGSIGGGTRDNEGKGVVIRKEDSSTNDCVRKWKGQCVERKYSEATSSDLLSVASIERRLRKLSITESSVVGGEGVDKDGGIDSEIEALFPDVLIVDKPRKTKISKRKVWQRWRNIVRNKNKQANRKYYRTLMQEESKKESLKLVFDYSTGKLSESELDLLSKGETFCPTTHAIDIDRLKTDIYYFNRRLRLHEQFKDKEAGRVERGVSAYSRTTGQLGRGSHTPCRRSVNRNIGQTAVANKDTVVKHRQLPSVYDPFTLNRNLNRYTSCIQEDCLLAIKAETKLKDNIRKQHRVALKTLGDKINNKLITITKADKGSGIVVCDYELYVQKGTKYIEEEAGAYVKVEEIESELIARLVKQRNKIVEQLKKESIIPLQTATFCIKQTEEKVTGMKFYFKIHKDQNISTTPLRPLQSCISAPTHHLSLVLTDILQPLLNTNNIPSFIFDSNHLLFRLQTLGSIPSDCTLVSSDVSALYPSIPHQQGLEAIRLFLNSNTQYNNTQIEVLIKALRLVISENYVMWNSTIYKQVSGVAMGTPVAVAYANIFMAWVDSKVKQQARYIHEHIRFIDDNLFILPEDRIDDLMQIANNILPSIKYTHEKLDKKDRKGLAFLDTQLFIADQGHIEARLYTKPTDRHAYLLPSSYHPPHIVKNIPAAVFKRLRRLCSRDEWFREDAEQAKGWLLNRGYKRIEVVNALQQAEKLDRWDMIVRIEKKRGVGVETAGELHDIPFIVTYNKHAKTLKKVLKRRQDLLDSSYKHTKVRPRVTFRRQRNLDDLLIQKALRGPIRHLEPADNVFVRCGVSQKYRVGCPCKESHEIGQCRCCAHASLQPIDSKVKLRKRVDCGSKNLVYLVGCRKCDKKYVGETQQTLRDRLLQHLNNVAKLNQPLYLHFRRVHAPKYLYITVLETVRNTEQFFRKVREAWWINHLQTLEPNGFNVKLDCNQIYHESN